MLMDGSSPHFARRKEGRGDECWAIDELFAGNRQAKLPCGTRALWDALSARHDNNGRPEPGAPLALCPRLRWRWSFGSEQKTAKHQSRRAAAKTFTLQERL